MTEAPVDPRNSWDLPSLGRLPETEGVEDCVVRVLAPNPSPMALDGTNTYVIGAPGGDAMVVDPGPTDESHFARGAEIVRSRDVTVAAIFVTHHHLDHSAAAAMWAERFECPIISGNASVSGPAGHVVGADESLQVGGYGHIDVIPTPGHTRDHLALRLPSGSVLTGDHVLGRGTSVVTFPDGDLVAYLESLQRVLDLEPHALLPGHGPVMYEEPEAVVRFYQQHRRYRERQIIDVLSRGPATVDEIVRTIYRGFPEHLLSPAAASTCAALAALTEQQRVGTDADWETSTSAELLHKPFWLA